MRTLAERTQRFHKTMLEDFYAIAFGKKIYSTLEQLQQDLDEWLAKYNQQRSHQRKRCQGRIPMKTFFSNHPLVIIHHRPQFPNPHIASDLSFCALFLNWPTFASFFGTPDTFLAHQIRGNSNAFVQPR
jgi:hypothetical protein